MSNLFNKQNIKIINIVILIIIFVFLVIFFWRPFAELFLSSQKIKEFILRFGILAPMALIALTAFQVLIAPIPGQAIGIVSGFIFGPILGTLLNMIGLVIGSYFAFVLARKLGRPFVEKILNKKIIKKFDKLFLEKGIFALFLVYLLPFFPDDAICYIAGLTRIKIKTLIIISALGRFPGFLILNLVGAGMAYSNIIFIIIFLSIPIVLFFIIFFKEKFKKVISRITPLKTQTLLTIPFSFKL